MTEQDGKETNNNNDLMQVQNILYRQMGESPNSFVFIFKRMLQWYAMSNSGFYLKHGASGKLETRFAGELLLLPVMQRRHRDAM